MSEQEARDKAETRWWVGASDRAIVREQLWNDFAICPFVVVFIPALERVLDHSCSFALGSEDGIAALRGEARAVLG